jgi:hypothetical protein
MHRIASVLVCSALVGITGGCITGRFTAAAQKWRRAEPERLTATSVGLDDAGVPYAVVALEEQCRVTPGDPEGGPGATQYALPRVASPNATEARFLAERSLEPVATYRAGSESLPGDRAPPGDGASGAVAHGFPGAVLLAEDGEGRPALFLGTAAGWAPVPVGRYIHIRATKGHPVFATVAEVLLVPFTLAFDLATFPVQWLLAPWLPLTPP